MLITWEIGASFLQETQPCFIPLILPLYCTWHQSNQIWVSRTSAYSVQCNYRDCSWRTQWFLETSEFLAHGQLKKLFASMHLTLFVYLRVSEKLLASSESIKKKITFLNTEYLPAWRFKTQPSIFFCKVSLSSLILTQSFLSWESERNTTQVSSSLKPDDTIPLRNSPWFFGLH